MEASLRNNKKNKQNPFCVMTKIVLHNLWFKKKRHQQAQEGFEETEALLKLQKTENIRFHLSPRKYNELIGKWS